MKYNIGKPTDVCDSCGASLVRYIDFNGDSDTVYQDCPDCSE